MMRKLFILVFAGTACMCSSATPASPKNFNDTLSGLLPFSWMVAKCPRKLFLRAGVATWRMAPLLCQVYCNRRTQARLCASSLSASYCGATKKGRHHDAHATTTYFHHWRSVAQTKCVCFFLFPNYIAFQVIAWFSFSRSCSSLVKLRKGFCCTFIQKIKRKNTI